MSNSMRGAIRALLVLLALTAHVTGARAQCLDWASGFESAGLDAPVDALTVFDDGSGSALYVGGSFTTAGDAVSPGVARWDGAHWSGVGPGLNGEVHALQVFDDGGGPALYAGGLFKIGSTYVNIARWNGAAWSTLGNGLDRAVWSMTVYDDGSGPALIAGGEFSTSVGTGLALNHVARWNGTVWHELWTGVGSWGGQSDYVFALASYADGSSSGPVLFAGGYFTNVGSVTQYGIARWNGTDWSMVGGGLSSGSTVQGLVAFDDGSGAGQRLFVSGLFHLSSTGEAANLATWDGSIWAIPPGIVPGANGGQALGVHDDGTGPALYIGGNIQLSAGPMTSVARWDGSQFSGVGGGTLPSVRALCSYDDGSGAQLFAGGTFLGTGTTTASRIARWDGVAWNRVSSGEGLSAGVEAFALFDDGTGGGSVLYAAGAFGAAGEALAQNIARWNGSGWTALGSGTNGAVHALCTFDDGTGSALYAGGNFTSPGSGSARWNGSTWSALQASPPDVLAFCAVDLGGGAGTQLYAAIDQLDPFNPPPTFLYRWDGSAWLPVFPSSNFATNALCAFDDGTGTKLYAAGGNGNFGSVASWNGVAWSQLGGMANEAVRALAVFDDGSGGGPALYAAGDFTVIGGVPSSRIVRWNGSSWSPLGLGLNGAVHALMVFDDGWGSGPKLYAGGEFTTAGGNPAVRIARWNGTNWSAMGSGISGVTSLTDSSRVQALASFDDGHGSGRDLYAAGTFTIAGARPSSNIAKWEGCGATGTPFCFGDGSLATACPCSNTGNAGHGCAHSQSAAGALLTASGVAHPDSIVLTSSNMLPSALTIYLQGDSSNAAGLVFGDGVRCAAGHLLRIGVKTAVSGTDHYPGAGDPSITARSAALGAPIPPHATRFYQAYYRDPNPAFCPPPMGSTFNVTNGIRIVW
jgi:hypothetical protein